jgi:hypothetical protein
MVRQAIDEYGFLIGESSIDCFLKIKEDLWALELLGVTRQSDSSCMGAQ